MHYSLIPPAYPYYPASPYPYPAYPIYEGYGRWASFDLCHLTPSQCYAPNRWPWHAIDSFATEPAGAAAGAYDPQFYMQRFG